MEYNINIYEPKRIFEASDFPVLVSRWKSGDYDEEECISIRTKLIYYNKPYITVAPMSLWTAQYVNGIRQVLSFDAGTSKSLRWHTANETITEFHKKYPTRKGTLFEMSQSGHSFILQLGMCKLKNTIRSYIYAETKLLPPQIAMTRKMAATFLHIYSDQDVVQVPPTISIFMKRDPVLWSGGIVVVTEIVLIDKETRQESIGICPLVMDAMNADIDGDTIIIYIVESDEQTRRQQESLLSPYVWGLFGARWSPTTSHLQLIFYQMLTCYFSDVLALDNDPNIRSRFIECLTRYDGSMFGEFAEIFLIARAQVLRGDSPSYEASSSESDGNESHGNESQSNESNSHESQASKPPSFYEILRRMIILSYYRNRHWDCITMFNDIIRNGRMMSITRFEPNSLFFAVMEFTGAIKYTNTNFFGDLEKLSGKEPYEYLFQTCPKEYLDKMSKFRSEYINSSSDLPKQSYHTSLLLNNVQTVKYVDGNVILDDDVIVQDLAAVVSLNDFVDHRGLEFILDDYEARKPCVAK